jgi:hypothetical protein
MSETICFELVPLYKFLSSGRLFRPGLVSLSVQGTDPTNLDSPQRPQFGKFVAEWFSKNKNFDLGVKKLRNSGSGLSNSLNCSIFVT